MIDVVELNDFLEWRRACTTDQLRSAFGQELAAFKHVSIVNLKLWELNDK